MRVDRWFLLAGAVYIMLGVSLGMYMGSKQDFTLMPWHAHINLVGWASMALYGVIYRSFPELAASKLAPTHFAIALVGSVVMLIGLPLQLLKGQETMVIIGSMIWSLGALTFLVIVVRGLFGAPRAARVAPAE